MILALLAVVPVSAVLAARQSTAGAIELPVERASNVFFARTMINGAGPFWLTLDTGATLTVLDPATVGKLGLPTTAAGQFANVGVAQGVTEMATTSGATLHVGSAPAFSPSPAYVVSVGASGGFKRQIDGVLGTDFLRRFVVEFNYDLGRVVLHPAGAFAYEGDGIRVPMTVQGNVLLSRAELTLPNGDAVPARLLIDTGSSQGLTLNSPFVAQHRITERVERPAKPNMNTRASVSIGINGLIASPMVSMPSVAFGGAMIANPDVALSSATEGLTASTSFDGIIGAALLKQFTVIVDYPRREIIFARTAPR